MKIDLGKIAITLGGNWNKDTSYEALTFVLHSTDDAGDGCGYVAKKDNIGVTPASDESVWMKVTQPGASIYELAKAHGYEGTEEEFVQEYNNAVQAAIDAAAEARSVAKVAKEAEESREAAEQARVNAETARIAAEQARALAESARVAAETARVAAETARAGASASIIAACTTAKTLCDEATALCNSTITSAKAAVAQMQADVDSAIEDADAATARANAAAEATAQLNVGLIGLKVEDGELILVQNAQTGVAQTGSIDDDGMVTIEFTV